MSITLLRILVQKDNVIIYNILGMEIQPTQNKYINESQKFWHNEQ